ncbi:hypothetical protein HMPREF1608_03609 [Escherichia coli 908525]|nr:hypothetical protein HMPREF1595_01939 [Escherichia coli 907672]ESD67747.1 hypothetical protein HMPREF1608_03609 [Escherichia coli 908525]
MSIAACTFPVTMIKSKISFNIVSLIIQKGMPERINISLFFK